MRLEQWTYRVNRENVAICCHQQLSGCSVADGPGDVQGGYQCRKRAIILNNGFAAQRLTRDCPRSLTIAVNSGTYSKSLLLMGIGLVISL